MKINYKSDFDFILTLRDATGADMGFPPGDWKVLIASDGCYGKTLRVGCSGGVCQGCFNDGGRIHVVADSHGLSAGRLHAEVVLNPENAIYPDGRRLTVAPVADLGIELVRGAGDEPVTGSVEVSVPALLLSAYDLAVRQGYNGTAQEYMEATLELVQTVEAARQTLEQSQAAAAVATEAAETVGQVMDDARAATEAANRAAGNAGSAAGTANAAASNAGAAGGYANAMAAEARAAKEACADWLASAGTVARTDANNNFTAAQTVNGTLTVNGDIVQMGEAYVSHAEHVESADDHITLRKGAVGGLGAQERAGLEIEKYDGQHDGVVELGADGTLRVGDKGDAQPLLTRAEASELPDGALLRWDAAAQRAVALPMRTVEMVVTYEDDSTETFMVFVKAD